MSKIIIFLLHILLCSEPLRVESWIKAGYWLSGSKFPSSAINSALFTHLLCAFADLNSSSYEHSSSSSDEKYFSTLTDILKQKNPTITALLSIGGGTANYSVLAAMVRKASYRKSFIDSSVKIARSYGFQGLDLCWDSAKTSSDMTTMGLLFHEWRDTLNSEAKNSSRKELLLTAAVHYSPDVHTASFPVESIQSNLNWVQVMAYDYYMPRWSNFTGAHAALYYPSSNANTDYGVGAWIDRGSSPSKLVLALPFYGYAWTLKNPNDSGIGAPATGPTITDDGYMSYNDIIKGYTQRYGVAVRYNATYVVKYSTIGSIWIGFDDVQIVKIKVSYAREKKILGYHVWRVAFDDNWELSLAAQEEGNKRQPKWRLFVIVLPTTSVILVLGLEIYYARRRMLNLKGIVGTSKEAESKLVNRMAAAGDFNSDDPVLQVYGLAEIEPATDKLSIENKLGEGGYGPVYKGVLPNGQEIAMKKLKQASTHGFEEF